MKVKAIHALQGLGETFAPGEIVDLSPDEAEKLLAIGAVELVTAPEPSKPVKPTGKQPQAK